MTKHILVVGFLFIGLFIVCCLVVPIWFPPILFILVQGPDRTEIFYYTLGIYGVLSGFCAIIMTITLLEGRNLV